MTHNKLERLRGEIAELRRAKAVKSREIVRLAAAIGLKLSNRGKEPTYVHDDFSNRRPVSIPAHPTLAIGTKNNILDSLGGYLDAYEERVIEESTSINSDLGQKKARRLS